MPKRKTNFSDFKPRNGKAKKNGSKTLTGHRLSSKIDLFHKNRKEMERLEQENQQLREVIRDSAFTFWNAASKDSFFNTVDMPGNEASVSVVFKGDQRAEVSKEQLPKLKKLLGKRFGTLFAEKQSLHVNLGVVPSNYQYGASIPGVAALVCEIFEKMSSLGCINSETVSVTINPDAIESNKREEFYDAMAEIADCAGIDLPVLFNAFLKVVQVPDFLKLQTSMLTVEESKSLDSMFRISSQILS